MKLSKFSQILAEIMDERGYSQEDIAKMAFTKQQTVSRWLKETNQPVIDTVLILSYNLGISPNELLGYNEIDEEEIKKLRDSFNR